MWHTIWNPFRENGLFGGIWGIFSLCLGIACIAILILTNVALEQAGNLPEPFYVVLPPSKVRPLPAQITLAREPIIVADLEEVWQWDDAMVIAYQVTTGRRGLKVVAIRPYPGIPEMFQKAEKTFPVPDDWGNYHQIEEIAVEGHRLKVSPRGPLKSYFIVSGVLIGLITICAVVVNPQLNPGRGQRQTIIEPKEVACSP